MYVLSSRLNCAFLSSTTTTTPLPPPQQRIILWEHVLNTWDPFINCAAPNGRSGWTSAVVLTLTHQQNPTPFLIKNCMTLQMLLSHLHHPKISPQEFPMWDRLQTPEHNPQPCPAHSSLCGHELSDMATEGMDKEEVGGCCQHPQRTLWTLGGEDSHLDTRPKRCERRRWSRLTMPMDRLTG